MAKKYIYNRVPKCIILKVEFSKLFLQILLYLKGKLFGLVRFTLFIYLFIYLWAVDCFIIITTIRDKETFKTTKSIKKH